MIRRSLFIMWLATIGICLISLIPDGLHHAQIIKEATDILFLIMLYISMGGFFASVVQFGVDQLPDASSNDITAFCNWYIWAANVGYAIRIFFSDCICTSYITLAKVLLPACVTIALCLDYNFNHWLIKEPVSENPLKLIYRVIRYAWKNKYPRQRSAFTYWDDKRYSRLDLAKHKFGGPFTTEKVEDVKTFWRIVVFILITLAYVSFNVSSLSVAKNMKYHLRNARVRTTSCSIEDISRCFQSEAPNYLGYFLVIAVIPLYELLLQRLMPRPSLFTQFNIGMCLAFLSMIGYLSLEIGGHIKIGHNETNITCLLVLKKSDYSIKNSLPLDHKWIMIPKFFYILSYFFLYSAAVKFVCAQSPYSMKGLMFGLGFGIYEFSNIAGYLMLLPFRYTAHKWPPNRYGCGTWYLLSVSIVLLLVCITFYVLTRRYKKRQRGDVLPNEQIFATNYYSRYVMYNSVEDIST